MNSPAILPATSTMKYFLPFLLLILTLYACKKETFDAEVQLAEDKAIIRKYLADNNISADSTESGLFYLINYAGTGSRPDDSSVLVTNYTGYLADHTVFDTNKYADPDTFFILNLIQGWQEGIKKIRTGGSISLMVPSALGYGVAGFGSIPSNTVIFFDIELVDHF